MSLTLSLNRPTRLTKRKHQFGYYLKKMFLHVGDVAGLFLLLS
jgi:hypothetical protein